MTSCPKSSRHCGLGSVLLLCLVCLVLPNLCTACIYCGRFYEADITDRCPSQCKCKCGEVYCNSSLITELNGTLDRADLFDSLNGTKVVLLDLSNNEISQIDEGFFQRLSIVKICHLILTNNRLTKLDGPELEGLNVGNIYLSHNAISYIDPLAFQRQSFQARKVDLSYNAMTYFDIWAYTKHTIREINLNHNNISEFKNSLNFTIHEIVNRMFNTNTKSCITELRNNHVSANIMSILRQTYHFDLDQDSTELLKYAGMCLDLSKNEIECDCKLYDLVYTIQNDLFTLREDVQNIFFFKCTMPSKLNGIRINHIPIEQLVCPVNDACPESCLCEEVPAFAYTRVDCHSANLTTLPLTVPPGHISLDLSRNAITELEPRPYLHRLKGLDLSHNELDSISPLAAKNLIDIQAELDLSFNVLRTLPKEIQVVKGEFVILDNNDLVCSCDQTWISDWLRLSSAGTSHLTSVCSKGDHSDILLTEMDDVLVCIDDLVLPLTISFTLFFLIIILIVIACRFYGRKRIPYFVYLVRGHKPEPNPDVELEKIYEYDVYLSFDNNDMNVVLWVKDFLMKGLENGQKHFKTVCPLRDFGIGDSRADEICEYIGKSRRFISIVSRKYFNPIEWTSFEYDHATHEHNEGNSMLIITFENIEDDDIGQIQNEAAKEVFKEGNYLKKNQLLFWSKLRYFMLSGEKMF